MPLYGSIELGMAQAPSGSRGTSPTEGQLYYDTDDNTLYNYNGTSWVPVSAIASGGTITTYTGYKVHTFLLADSGNDFVVLGGALTCDIIVVGGGAAGSIDHGGGGGAGGIAYKDNYSLAADTYTVTVGAGGTAGFGSSSGGSQSGDTARMFGKSAAGAQSSFSSLLVAYGGEGAIGCCGTVDQSGGNFGSGGGALRTNSVGAVNKGTTTISGTLLGNTSTAGTDADYGGGGGGAGGVGASSADGDGGIGWRASDGKWDTWGTDTNNDAGGGYFAGGGGGGSHNSNSFDDEVHGGYGGGGGFGDDGFGNLSTDEEVGQNGMASTGGGGTGLAHTDSQSNYAGNGGSGIVIVRYAV